MVTVPVAKPTVPQSLNKSAASSSCPQHQATCPYPAQDFLIYLQSILILSYHLRLDPTSGSFLQVSPTISLLHMARQTHHAVPPVYHSLSITNTFFFFAAPSCRKSYVYVFPLVHRTTFHSRIKQEAIWSSAYFNPCVLDNTGEDKTSRTEWKQSVLHDATPAFVKPDTRHTATFRQ